MSEQTPSASAGSPNGRSPSGATSPGTTPVDEAPVDEAPERSGDDEHVETQAPGDVPGASLPAVAAGQGPSPETPAGEKAPDSDAATASPGAFVALAPAGHPDGEVDTRAR